MHSDTEQTEKTLCGKNIHQNEAKGRLPSARTISIGLFVLYFVIRKNAI